MVRSTWRMGAVLISGVCLATSVGAAGPDLIALSRAIETAVHSLEGGWQIVEYTRVREDAITYRWRRTAPRSTELPQDSRNQVMASITHVGSSEEAVSEVNHVPNGLQGRGRLERRPDIGATARLCRQCGPADSPIVSFANGPILVRVSGPSENDVVRFAAVIARQIR